MSMPWTAAPWTSWSRSPTITTCGPGVDAELVQGVGDDLVLGPPAGLVRRPGEHGEAVGEAEVLEDAHGRLLRLGRGQRQHHAGGDEVVEHLDDAVVEPRTRTARRAS